MSSDGSLTSRPFSEIAAGIESGDSAGYLVDGINPEYALRPESVDELREIVRSARADGLAIIPWGGGTQMGFGNLPEAYRVAVDLTRLNSVLRYEPDDMTMSVEAGCRLGDLNRMLSEHRQVLPVDAADPEQATIGGMTAVGASGPRRLGFGPLRDLIIGITVLMSDGTVATAGGQVVKNVTGYDMMRLHHGALGSLGIVLSLNLKVIPKPQSERTVLSTYPAFSDADRAARAVIESQLGVTACVVTEPEMSSVLSGEASSAWMLAVRCEAPPSAVVRQSERVAGFLGEGASDARTLDDSETSAALWQRAATALNMRPGSNDVSVRLGCPPSKMADLVTRLESVLGDKGTRASGSFDYGSGVVYLRTSNDAGSPEVGSFVEHCGHLGDHVTVLTAPESVKQGIDVFGGQRAGFSMIESLKQTFDPDRILNPGRFIGRL